MAYDGDKTINGLTPIDNVTLETEIVVWDEVNEEAKKGTVQQLKDVIAEGVSAGVAYKGTRAGYETAKLIPAGEEGFIPDSSLVIITDENRTYVTSGTGAEQTLSLVARVMSAGDGISISNSDVIKADTVIFTGTRAEWEALSTAQKAKFNIVNITDEELTEDAITDTVEVGNMKAVTSNAVANAINNVSSVLVSVTGHLGNMYLCKVGKVVYMSFNSDWTSLASGDNPNLATIPQGYRPIARCGMKETSTTNATLYINEDGSVTCYNYGSAITQATNGNYFACWITRD